ncbi:2-keto-3-deoxygluconate kinase [Breoghania corrubedonensis]|uniref:2-keto-3-deoxygluconate kinase n=1 Tax=Breoghania corrubedonensis TaxID=665038 RepID=A0A2T5V5D4_9HYPH|nr:sugar kinase [Breoghania corrubedonensis]PTW58971.1 2-keto-3-deoxygluconate kinase [Breoghania corrubedonensis]
MKRFLAIGECMLELSGAGADLWRMGIAGDTLNTAWYARACLPDDWAVSFATCIGKDEFSARVPGFMAENGIETDRIRTHPTRSVGLYAISLEHGERSFAYWRDNSAARTLADDAEAMIAMTQGASVIHISGITLAILPPPGRARLIELLARKRAEGVTTVLDPNIRPRLWSDMETAAGTLSDAARCCDIVLPSFEDEAACFHDRTPHDTCARYAELGARTVIVKNGGGAVVARHDIATCEFDTRPESAPIDTTGAGDSFNGACLAALVTGSDLSDAVRKGQNMARKVIGHHGALIPMEKLLVPEPD